MDAESVTMRIRLISKPEQSGKTFEMLKRIVEFIETPPCDKRVINIIFCDNNLLLTQQTSNRVNSFLNGDACVILSCKSKKRVDEVKWAVTGEGVANVLCCTNRTRADDARDVVVSINRRMSGDFFFHIWVDEADKYIEFINAIFKPLVEEYENVALYLITATPHKLFAEYRLLNVMPIENTTSSDYHGWLDNEIHLVDFAGTATGFVTHVLQGVGAQCVRPGTRWYIPAEYKKTSHIAVKDACIQHGFATIVINGDGIKLYLPDTIVHEYAKDDELNPVLMEIYKRHELARYPLAITGNMCIGRGISLMSNDFMMDCGIISACHNPQEASQNAGRLKGNIKSWENYKPPVVFTTEQFNAVAKKIEAKSRELANVAFLRECEGFSTLIDKHQFRAVGHNRNYAKRALTKWAANALTPKDVAMIDGDGAFKRRVRRNGSNLWVHKDDVVRCDGDHYSMPGGRELGVAQHGNAADVLEYNPERTMYRIVRWSIQN